MGTCPTYLVDIVHRYASDLGYCDASGVGEGGVCINPYHDGINRFWRV